MSRRILSAWLMFWAGLICAISFFEAWLKFRAEGVTREIGLSIGKLVFTSLNRIELAFMVVIWILSWKTGFFAKDRFLVCRLMLVIVTGALAFQTFWALPTLVEHASIIIAGKEPPKSLAHIGYGISEFVKVLFLIQLSWRLSAS